ncbi:hypothetical protein SAMN04489716_6889 [Actinoplanes derwentensis]|uniref:Uncharacterized protein n=1 Tax=Actinoplanes derwentensis TaxID=113562 RepID=A0A1H2CVT7_9ACTN|nr:hypothetical protein Ade03nite_08620 [Actinoplanes derwentensis]SDT74136.1 hypothetical protein SAMN04489716_6889 [Actinoplanes derwentensis]
MGSTRVTPQTTRQATFQTQVLGWIASGDVLRDDRFVYRAVGRPAAVDDIVYELDAAGLVELLVDGRVRLTPEGRSRWARTQSQRHAASTWHQLQFIPASVPPS